MPANRAILKRVFHFYCKIHSKNLPKEQLQHANETVSLREWILFCKDFGLSAATAAGAAESGVLTHRAILSIFHSSVQHMAAIAAAKSGNAAATSTLPKAAAPASSSDLDFPHFLLCLFQVVTHGTLFNAPLSRGGADGHVEGDELSNEQAEDREGVLLLLRHAYVTARRLCEGQKHERMLGLKRMLDVGPLVHQPHVLPR